LTKKNVVKTNLENIFLPAKLWPIELQLETSQSAKLQFIGGFGLTSLQKAIARGMFELRMSLSLTRLTNVLLSSSLVQLCLLLVLAL